MLRAAFTRRTITQIRSIHKSSIYNAASVFKMPAMSPTMSEGGIVAWKIKPGDSYSAGDAILEVETDKANIDVEAADDGKLWEILINEGTSGIPVGKAIALIAEQDDDLSTLENQPLKMKLLKHQRKNLRKKKSQNKKKNQLSLKLQLITVYSKTKPISKIIPSC